MPTNVPNNSPNKGLDLFIAAGPSLESCTATIGDVFGMGIAQIVRAEDFDDLLLAIKRATTGWAVYHQSGHRDYPHQFDVNVIDGPPLTELVTEIVRRLGVSVVIPDDETDDPYAGLRFDPDGSVRSFSLLPFNP